MVAREIVGDDGDDYSDYIWVCLCGIEHEDDDDCSNGYYAPGWDFRNPLTSS